MPFFGPFWYIKLITCVFGPINCGPFGPNGRFPGTFWPKPSLLGCLRSLKKNLGQNSLYKFFFRIFKFWGILRVLRRTTWSWGQPAPKTGQKAQRRPKKRVLGITLARQNVFTCLFGFKNHFWGRPTVLEGLQTPTERSGPPLGPTAGFAVGGPGGPEKKFSPRIFFVQKRYSLGPGWVLGPKNSFWTPLDPPQGAILAHFTHKMAKMGFKNGQKTHFFHKTVLL